MQINRLAAPGNIRSHRGWCPKCARQAQRKSINELQDYASSRGGKLLSERYTSVKAEYRWQCADGHEWTARADHTLRGSWCPQCANNLSERMCRGYFESIFQTRFPTRRPKWLRNEWGNLMELDGYNEDLRLAFEYNGKQHYKRLPVYQKSHGAFERLQRSDATKLELCRQHGVMLLVIPYSVRTEELGEYIAGNCAKLGLSIPTNWSVNDVDLSSAYSPRKLQKLREFAECRGGKLLSEHYLGTVTKHEWECANGHRWRAIADAVLRGSWCPECGGTKRKSIADAETLANARGGECLSTDYTNNSVKLRWKCAKGHVWLATYGNVKQGSWCHVCGGSKPKSLEDMHQLAQRQGGKCLSKKFVNVETKLTWECANGHRWKATPNNIQQGKWCPKCRDTRLSINYMQELAGKHGGKCLSKRYTNNRDLLEWQCAEGHRWRAQPRHVVDGSWCRQCTHQKRKRTLEDMQALATAKGGHCLSPEYVNVTTHLEWQCAKGHRWLAKPNNIQQGKWCPECFNLRRGKRTERKLSH